MSCKIEVLQGYIVANPNGTKTNIALNPDHKYTVITVFNETDKDIQLFYSTANGQTANFWVPKGGRTFTRIINGTITFNSLFQQSSAAAVGSLIINLGN
jgi:hypothetical protein